MSDSGFIRDELRRAAIRWRETIAGGIVALLGLWIALTTFAAFALLGWALAALGAVLAIAGVPRALFRNAGGGAGVVELDEGALTYLSPVMGGSLAVGEITQVALSASDVWLVLGADGTRLDIPVDAEGAEQLFDVFNTLPGLAPGEAARIVRALRRETVVLWAKPRTSLPRGVH